MANGRVLISNTELTGRLFITNLLKHPAKVINPSAIHCFLEIFLETTGKTTQLTLSQGHLLKISLACTSTLTLQKCSMYVCMCIQGLVLNQTCSSMREGGL